jgi:hypothetical protein
MQLLKISIDLHNVSDQNLIGFGIQNALRNGEPIKTICDHIYHQGKDCPSVMMDCVGYDLYNQIKSLYETK